ncbi:MAG TPA: rhodanese-like domain-containing protein [bacterium]|jgi:rhodanese-related sulfurtransferase|nr:rhodanese-like domain-containing protein [bacterium]
MKPSRYPADPKTILKPPSSLSRSQVLSQAWGLFIFSGIFAVLFNAFYADGIELKFKPPRQTGFHPSSPVSISGFDPSLAPGTPPGTPTPLPAAADNVIRLSLSGTKDRFDKKNCVFLDARKPEEYTEGHIPGALNFYGNELDKFAPRVIPQIPDKNKEVIAYCHGGDCDLSLLVARSLIETGYTRVEIFTGGWPEWKKAGYPITPGENP